MRARDKGIHRGRNFHRLGTKIRAIGEIRGLADHPMPGVFLGMDTRVPSTLPGILLGGARVRAEGDGARDDGCSR